MQHYLIIQLARFGDVVQTKRLVKTLMMRGQVHLCLDSSLAAIGALLYPKAILHTLPMHGGLQAENAQAVHKCFQELADVDFTAVYNLNHAGINRALARLFTPERVYGYSMYDAQIVRSAWVRKAFVWTQNRTTTPINLVDFWAHFDAAPCLPQDVNPQAQGQGRGIGVVLAGRQWRRSLPMHVLAPIVRTAFELLGGPPVFLLGSHEECALARKLKRELPATVLQRVQDLSGKTSWEGLVDALAGLDMLISPDTGTMHLAAHMGVPVQAFFLSSAWCHETGPYGVGHTVWQAVHDCAPCLESAPCLFSTQDPSKVVCLQDFCQTSFLRAFVSSLSQKENTLLTKANLPRTLTCQTSYIDAFGSAWRTVMGQDVYAQERAALRASIAEYCHVPLTQSLVPFAEKAYGFYEEADWMLPNTDACKTHCLTD